MDLTYSKTLSYTPANNRARAIQNRKTFVFWALVCLLLILVLGNLILTITVLSVLKLGRGMRNLELISEESAVKFFGDIDLGHLYKADGHIEGFANEPLEISGVDGPLVFRLNENHRPVEKLKLDKNEILIENVEVFNVKRRGSVDEALFSTDQPSYNLPNGVRKLHVKAVEANRIVSPVNDSLELKAELLHLKGIEGVKIDGKEVSWFADQHVFLTSTNRSVSLDGDDGVVLNTKSIPVSVADQADSLTGQWKICVCMPGGKLFRIPVRTEQIHRTVCNNIDMSDEYNPCI